MKVLVSAAGRHGATVQIGGVIAQTLRDNGVPADFLPPQQITGIEGYDALVLGSAVYAGRWMSSARELAGRVGGQLAGRPVWLFSSGPLGDPPRPDPKSQSPVDIAAIAEKTAAREHRVFGGRLVRAQLGRAERLIATVMRIKDQDRRDWNEITAWAEQIAGQLKAARSPAPAPEQNPDAAL